MGTTVFVMKDGGLRTFEDLSTIETLIADRDATVWIDADHESPEVIHFLRETLGLHPLTIEDIFSERVTPKIEDYPEFLYVVMHGVRTDPQRVDVMSTIEVDVVIGSNWVFTHHSLPLLPLDALKADLRRNPRALQRGPAFVAHAVIDRLTDCYLPVLDEVEERIDGLEKRVVEDPSPELLTAAFEMRRGLQQLRRIAVYQREILQRLSRGEFDTIPPAALPFFRDVFDQFVRVSDLVDSYRELVVTALEMYLSVTSNRTNEIMKLLALISTVMLPLTFIAGVYGMNFEHMPELKWRYGYPFALGMMAVVAAALTYWFRHRRWL